MSRKRSRNDKSPTPIGRRALMKLQRRRGRVNRFHALADACSDSDSDSDDKPLSHGRKERQPKEEPTMESQHIRIDPKINSVTLRMRLRESRFKTSPRSNFIDLTEDGDNTSSQTPLKPLIHPTSETCMECCTYLSPLSAKDKRMLQTAFACRDNDVVVYHRDSNIPIRGSSFKTLKDGRWLDDEIMNAFAGMISSRNSRTKPSAKPTSRRIPKTYMFSTFFHSRLKSRKDKSDYSAIRRWTRRAEVDVTKYDLLLFPIHVNGNHWALCVIDFKFKEFQYLDTLYAHEKEGTVKSLREWLYEEIKSSKGAEVADGFNIAKWNCKTNKYRVPGEDKALRVIPHQTDSSSCGVLSLKIADCLATGIATYFTQSDASLLRKKIALDILRTNLPPAE